MSDTLIFIQASNGPRPAEGMDYYPNNATTIVDEDGYGQGHPISSAGYVLFNIINYPPVSLKSEVVIYTSEGEPDWQLRSEIEECGFDYYLLTHPSGKAATFLSEHLQKNPGLKRVVRLLGNHTFTDPSLVHKMLEHFDTLAPEVQATLKLCPDICGFGQNIEVFSPRAFLASLQNASEDFITNAIPAAPVVAVRATSAKQAKELASQDFNAMGLYSFISPLFGTVQEATTQNVRALVTHFKPLLTPADETCATRQMSPTFEETLNGWEALGLSVPKWQWSQPEFAPRSFDEVRTGIARGITTVAINPPGLSVEM